MKTFPASFPHTVWFFFWLFFVFFSGFLPVLRTICGWEPSLHPFPILFDFFLIIFCFFSQGLCQFWEHSVDEHLPCILSPYYLMFFYFFFWVLILSSLFFVFWVCFLFVFFWCSIKSSILELSGLYSLTTLSCFSYLFLVFLESFKQVGLQEILAKEHVETLPLS